MVTKSSLLALYQGTHECLDLLVAHAAGMPPALFAREIPGFGIPSVRNQLVHLVSVERAWINTLQNRPVIRLKPDAFPTPVLVADEKERVVAATIEYLTRLDEETLNRDLVDRPIVWSGPLRSPAFIVQHVITHAFHHKGQIVTLFRMLEHPIGDTDLQRG